jgi:hypothetical protein
MLYVGIKYAEANRTIQCEALSFCRGCVMSNTVSYVGAWVAAVSVAAGLAFVSPTESSVMGEIPAFVSRTLAQQSMSIPEGLPTDRTLALIGFHKSHQAKVQSWIDGLDLSNDPSITWMRMAIINDPGTLEGRSAVETRLLRRYPLEAERARLLPAFVNRDQFVRAAGLHSANEVYAVVLNRQGEVLARAEGQFDPEKAVRLRETLRERGMP